MPRMIMSMPKFYFGLNVYLQQNIILYSIKPIKGLKKTQTIPIKTSAKSGI